MAEIMPIDTLHPVGKQLNLAAEYIRKAMAIYDEFQALRSEAIPQGAAKFTEFTGVTAGQQAFSDQMAMLKLGSASPATLVQLRSFTGLCTPAAVV